MIRSNKYGIQQQQQVYEEQDMQLELLLTGLIHVAVMGSKPIHPPH
jgi:hypothetical protein